MRELAIDELTRVQGGGPSKGVIAGAVVGAIIAGPEIAFIAGGALIGAGIAWLGGQNFR